MIDPPGDHPLPHKELYSQTPLIFRLNPGDALYRHHQSIHDPLHFGIRGNYRFDDPDCATGASFRVLYAGADVHCCFIESCGSTTGVPAVSGDYLAAREIAKIQLTEELRFIDLATSGGLTRVGADARLVTGSYKIAQKWSAALRSHPARPDGIRYPARHDMTRVAYAIFTRPRSSFQVTSLGSLMSPSNRTQLNQLLSDYNVELI